MSFKILFITSYLSIHTAPLFEELVNKGCKVTCIEVDVPSEERIKMGYRVTNKNIVIIPWNTFVTSQYIDICFDYCIISDLTKLKMISKKVKANSYFFMSEHILKNNKPRTIFSIFKKRVEFMRYFKAKNKYALCNSSYAGKEYLFFGFKRDNVFKFGYFPRYDFVPNISDSSNKILLWSGRFLKWKHPELAIVALKELLKYDKDFKLVYVGDGEQKRYIEKKIARNKLSDNVVINSFLSREELLQLMKKSDIYLFSSDKNEGWGVVLNEAMFNYCFVIASKKAGSTSFLINEVNGFSFSNKKSLKNAIRRYVQMPLSSKIQTTVNAHNAIENEWNYVEAANRLYYVFECIEKCADIKKFQDGGPISRNFE